MNLTRENMRVLSLWRPYPWLILTGEKDVENRGWSTPHRGPLVLHAGRNTSTPALEHLERRYRGALPDAAHSKGLVGLVDLVDVHHATECRTRCSPWAARGDYHWVMARPIAFPAPIPAPGRQKLYRLTPDQHATVTEYLRTAGVLVTT